MATSARGRSTWRRRFAALLGATLVALALGEGLVRAWGALRARPGPAEFLEYDPELGWRNRPGHDGRHATADFDVVVRFDAEGARCAEVGTPVPETPDGVLAVGDSMTFGWGVAAEQAFAARLGARLGLPVRNFGVSGFGPDQQLLLLRRLLARARPRLVVVLHQENDVVEVTQRWAYGRYKPAFELDGERLQLVGSPVPWSWLAEYSDLWRTVQKRAGAMHTQAIATPERARGRELVRHLYRAMAEACNTAGTNLVVVCADAGWLVESVALAGLRVCNLTKLLADLAASGPLTFGADPHWLPAVHGAVAAAIADQVLARQWLAAPAATTGR
ncbi:MAG: hypothetical protein JNK49_03380 [Planctomycetes bacterium]|nr:hypothetical protein [Planctomycetota bacterium]